MNGKSEQGAVVIEAALSLTLFMFAMLTIYSIYHVCLAQARIGAALNSTAKEISQYSYVYDLTSLNEKQSNLHANGGAAQAILTDNLSQVSGVYDALKGLAGTAVSVGTSPDNAESFLYYMLNEGIEAAKGGLTGELARGIMGKHFGSDPDAYLEGLGIEGGLSSLSFFKTRIFQNGEGNEILLDVRYQVTIVKLLDIDLKMNFEQCANTLKQEIQALKIF